MGRSPRRSPATGRAQTGGSASACTWRQGSVRLTLNEEQVAHVVSEASDSTGSLGSMLGVGDLEHLRQVAQPLLDDTRLSRSALRAVLVLAALPADGSESEVTEIAETLGFGKSTTYRYLSTWLALGLIEQDPRTRRYRSALRSAGQAAPAAEADR